MKQHYTIEEKDFIAKYRPIIELESIEFSRSTVDGEDLDYMDLSFVSDAALQRRYRDEDMTGEYEIVWATFRFRDRGADFPQKFVRFRDFARVLRGESYQGENAFMECRISLVDSYNVIADRDGRFSVSIPFSTLPMWEETGPEGDTDHLEILCKEQASFFFGKLTIGNEFVSEEFGMIRGTMAEGGKTENVRVFEISHALSSEEDEIYDTAEGKSEKQSIKKTNH